LPPYDMGTWARTLLDHEYDDDSECNVDSYNAPAKDIEKDLSPKSMKRWVKDANMLTSYCQEVNICLLTKS